MRQFKIANEVLAQYGKPGYKFSSENLFNRVKIKSEKRKENKVNIHSNVKKDNSKIILFIGVSIALMIAGLAYYNMVSSTTSITAPMQTNGMSEVDRIKQTIREKETIRDAQSEVAMDEARKGNTIAADAAAQVVGELNQAIEKLYDDLHEANMKEGENGETK